MPADSWCGAEVHQEHPKLWPDLGLLFTHKSPFSNRSSRGARGLAFMPLPAQALIGLKLVTVLVDLFVETPDLVREELIRWPPGRT